MALITGGNALVLPVSKLDLFTFSSTQCRIQDPRPAPNITQSRGWQVTALVINKMGGADFTEPFK